jgi:protein TonB
VIRSNRVGALGIAVLAAFAGGCGNRAPDTPPRQLSSSPFHYPEELWDAGVEGETMLEIHVSRSGSVDSAKVHESSGHEEFDSAAVRGVSGLRFEPARRGDDSVAVTVLLPVQFHLPEDSVGAPSSDDEP